MNEKELKRRTKGLSLQVIRLCEALPKTYVGETIGKQLLRSVTSVAANYRAACRGRSKREFVTRLGIVIEEADESMFWLEIIAESSLLLKERISDLIKEADQITAIFVVSRKTAQKGL